LDAFTLPPANTTFSIYFLTATDCGTGISTLPSEASFPFTTSPTFKVLEEGAATLSKEETSRLAAHQVKFIRNLEMALVRIENKTYGVCKTTGKLIPKERLMRVPHATECIEAKEARK
jgi:hypothetical protein